MLSWLKNWLGYPLFRVVGAIDSKGGYYRIEVKTGIFSDWVKYYYHTDRDGDSWFIRYTSKEKAVLAARHLSNRIDIDGDVEVESEQESVESKGKKSRLKVVR